MKKPPKPWKNLIFCEFGVRFIKRKITLKMGAAAPFTFPHTGIYTGFFCNLIKDLGSTMVKPPAITYAA